MARRGKRSNVQDVFRAAATLELSDLTLARILRYSGETIAQYRLGADLVQTGFHAKMVQELIETCDLIPGFLEPGQTSSQWLRTFNSDLDAVPLHVLEHEWGLDDLLAWLRGEGLARSPEAVPSEPRWKRATRHPMPEHPSAAFNPKAEPKANDGWWMWIAGGAVVVVTMAAGLFAKNRQ